jgi:transcriptional regulator with XRE-family HTH domain
VPTKVAKSRLLQRVGTRLRAARNDKALSQEAVAFAAGLDRSYVSGIERGEFNVSLLTLARIAKVLGVRLATLLDGE